MQRRFPRALWIMLAFGTLTLALPGVAFAAADPGKALGKWLYDNVTVFFPPLIALAGLWYLAKREFTTFISFMVFAGIVAVFVYFPENVKTVAKSIWDSAWGA